MVMLGNGSGTARCVYSLRDVRPVPSRHTHMNAPLVEPEQLRTTFALLLRCCFLRYSQIAILQKSAKLYSRTAKKPVLSCQCPYEELS